MSKKLFHDLWKSDSLMVCPPKYFSLATALLSDTSKVVCRQVQRVRPWNSDA